MLFAQQNFKQRPLNLARLRAGRMGTPPLSSLLASVSGPTPSGPTSNGPTLSDFDPVIEDGSTPSNDVPMNKSGQDIGGFAGPQDNQTSQTNQTNQAKPAEDWMGTLGRYGGDAISGGLGGMGMGAAIGIGGALLAPMTGGASLGLAPLLGAALAGGATGLASGVAGSVGQNLATDMGASPQTAQLIGAGVGSLGGGMATGLMGGQSLLGAGLGGLKSAATTTMLGAGERAVTGALSENDSMKPYAQVIGGGLSSAIGSYAGGGGMYTNAAQGILGGGTAGLHQMIGKDNPMLSQGLNVASGVLKGHVAQAGFDAPSTSAPSQNPTAEPEAPVTQPPAPTTPEQTAIAPLTPEAPVTQPPAPSTGDQGVPTPPVVAPRRNDTYVGPSPRPRGGDMWTQNALPSMGGLPTQSSGGKAAPLPDISPETMGAVDMAGHLANLVDLPGPVGNVIGAANTGAHIYQEGLTQRNTINAASSALNFVPALAPFNAARGVYDTGMSLAGMDHLTSTGLVDGAVTGMRNMQISPEAEHFASMSM